MAPLPTAEVAVDWRVEGGEVGGTRHPRAIEKFRALVKSPPSKLTDNQKKILTRVSTRLKPTSA